MTILRVKTIERFLDICRFFFVVHWNTLLACFIGAEILTNNFSMTMTLKENSEMNNSERRRPYEEVDHTRVDSDALLQRHG